MFQAETTFGNTKLRGSFLQGKDKKALLTKKLRRIAYPRMTPQEECSLIG